MYVYLFQAPNTGSGNEGNALTVWLDIIWQTPRPYYLFVRWLWTKPQYLVVIIESLNDLFFQWNENKRTVDGVPREAGSK